jgi:hypothetical protein
MNLRQAQEPRRAVEQADGLVAPAMKHLAELAFARKGWAAQDAVTA